MKQLVNGYEVKAKGLFLKEGLRKKVLGIETKADRSPKLETSLASIVRKSGTLLIIVISFTTRIRWLQIRKEAIDQLQPSQCCR